MRLRGAGARAGAPDGNPRPGSMGWRDMHDGRELTLYPMLFGNVRLCIGVQGAETYDDGWCFQDLDAALEAFANWDGVGEPAGAYRRVGQ